MEIEMFENALSTYRGLFVGPPYVLVRANKKVLVGVGLHGEWRASRGEGGEVYFHLLLHEVAVGLRHQLGGRG